MNGSVFLKVGDWAMATKSKLLAYNSPVFDRLINVLAATEIEVEDFDAETVELFIALLDLQDKRIEVIGSQYFRGLHKLSVVFEVDWMMKECHRYLVDKLDFRRVIKEDGLKVALLIWDECRFMVEIWGNRFIRFVDMFVDNVRSLEGIVMDCDGEGDGNLECHDLNRRFVLEFIKGFDNFTPLEMDVLLRISSVPQLDVILESLNSLLERNDALNDSLTYLLENINLPLCWMKLPDSYDNVMNALTNKFHTFSPSMFCVMKDSSRLPRLREILSVSDVKSFEWMREHIFEEGTDKLLYVAGHESVKSMNSIVDYILYVMFTFEADELPEIDDEEITRRLHEIYLERGLRKAHRQYVEGALNSLESMRLRKDSKMKCHTCGSSGWIWDFTSERVPCPNLPTAIHFHFDPVRLKYLKILRIIKESNDLSSVWDNVTVPCQGQVPHTDIVKFNFKHPAVPDCSRIGRCGFFLKIANTKGYVAGKEESSVQLHRDDTWSVKLSKDVSDRIHCHDEISPDDMNVLYTEFTAMDIDNCWLPSALFDESLRKLCRGNSKFVIYNVGDYLVKKRDVSYH